MVTDVTTTPQTQTSVPHPSRGIRPLTPADRCDRCGAQAYVIAILRTGDLMFCGHHARRYQEDLYSSAVHIHDYSAWILPEQTRPNTDVEPVE
jgi:ribosomal protein L37E